MTGPGRIELVAEELPPPGPRQALVTTRLGSVSVGTELAAYLGTDPRLDAGRYPLMTGYENVAVVREIGPGVDPDWVGRRVLATYGHRSAALLDHERLIAIHDDVQDDLALLAILAADAGRAVEHAEPAGGERCLILGAGALGLLTLLNLQLTGVERITIVDFELERLTLPASLGAVTAGPASVPHQYDVAFECSAAPEAFTLAQQVLQPRGRIVVVSDGNAGDLVLTSDFHDKELVVSGANSHPDLAAYAAAFFSEAATGAFDAYPAIYDAEIELTGLPALFARMAGGERVRKPLIRYD